MRHWKYTRLIIRVIFLWVVLGSCTSSDYTRLLKSELARGVREDSVFNGVKLGDSRAQYEELCLRMNKQQLFTMGPMGTVQYFYIDSIFHEKPQEIRILIDPSFDASNKIADVSLEFSYPGWAPWNREFAADSLIVMVERILMDWYKGNAFVIAHPAGKVLPVKVDGNRRILVYRKDDQTVLVKVQDLLHHWYNNSTREKESDKDKVEQN
jgi:hypothetical protein